MKVWISAVFCLLNVIITRLCVQGFSVVNNTTNEDVVYLQRQLSVLTLLERFLDPLTDPYQLRVAIEYDPKKHLEDFETTKETILEVINYLEAPPGSAHTASILSNAFQFLYYPKTFDTFMNCSCWLRQRSDDLMMFTYTFGAAFANRKDTRDFRLPPIYELLPSMYIPNPVLQRALRAHVAKQPGLFVADWREFGTNDAEGMLMYYHHDPDVVQHHMFWHVSHPFWWSNKMYGKKKNRRGELFWFIHHYALARYNIERQCNGFSEVPAFTLGKPMDVGVHPQINFPRGDPFPVQKANRTILQKDLDQMLIIDKLLNKGITDGYVFDKNYNKVSLKTQRGIDMMGDLIEACENSVNIDYYGSIHNTLHQSYSMTSDPDGSLKIPIGLLDNPHTGIMDPGFFRIHYYLDKLFKTHMDTFPPYTPKELEFPGISVTNVVPIEKDCCSPYPPLSHSVRTYFEEKFSKINYGFPAGAPEDHNPDIKVLFPVLSHEPFNWVFTINSNRSKSVEAAIRIFLSPPVTNRTANISDPAILEEVRWKAIELDRFVTTLKPGQNVIERYSKASSGAIPPTKDTDTLRRETKEALEYLLATGKKDKIIRNTEEFAHCGMPDRMLLPIGSVNGTKFHLIVVVTDWSKDRKGDNNTDNVINYNPKFPRRKDGGSLFCGVFAGEIPDHRPSNFPFDRKIDIESFAVPNIFFTQLRVFLEKPNSDDRKKMKKPLYNM